MRGLLKYDHFPSASVLIANKTRTKVSSAEIHAAMAPFLVAVVASFLFITRSLDPKEHNIMLGDGYGGRRIATSTDSHQTFLKSESSSCPVKKMSHESACDDRDKA